MSNQNQNTQASIGDKETTPEHILLNCLLTVNFMISCLENLQGTNYYNSVLKNKANHFYQELLRVMRKDVPFIFGIQDQNLFKLMDYIEQSIKDMALVRPEEIGIRNEIMTMLREQPEEVLAALNINMVDKIA